MGNCIGIAFSKHIKVIPDEDQAASMKIAPLPLGAMLKVPHKVQQQMLQMSHKVVAEQECDGKRIRLVVTKNELELLKRSAGDLQLRHAMLESILRKGKKWKPSLSTVPEL